MTEGEVEIKIWERGEKESGDLIVLRLVDFYANNGCHVRAPELRISPVPTLFQGKDVLLLFFPLTISSNIFR